MCKLHDHQMVCCQASWQTFLLRYRGHQTSQYGGSDRGDHSGWVPPSSLPLVRVQQQQGHPASVWHESLRTLWQTHQTWAWSWRQRSQSVCCPHTVTRPTTWTPLSSNVCDVIVPLQCLRSPRIQGAGPFSQRSFPLCQMWSSATVDVTCWPETTSPPRCGTYTWTKDPWRHTRYSCPFLVPVTSNKTDYNIESCRWHIKADH